MRHSKVKDLLSSEKTNYEVTVKGWVRTFRNNQFIALNDGSTIHNLQCVVDFENTPEATLKRINTGTAVALTGKLVESQGAGQKYEIQVSQLEILGDCDAEKFPMQPKKHSLEFLRENAHLRVRTNAFGAIMRVRSVLAHAVHTYFQERGFVYVNTPIITGADAEGAGEMFRVTTLPTFNYKPQKRVLVPFEKYNSAFNFLAKDFMNEIRLFLSENIESYELSFLFDETSDFSFNDLVLANPKNLRPILNKLKNRIHYKIGGNFLRIDFEEIIKENDKFKSIIFNTKQKIKAIAEENNWIITSKANKNSSLFAHISFYNLFNVYTHVDTSNHNEDFFSKQTNLTVSGQLEAETYAMALGQVYTFGPTFRAENSNTSRHLAEFWMIEPEVAFNDLTDNMDLAEDFIKFVIQYAVDRCGDDLKFLEGRLLDEEKQKPQAERSEMALLEKLNFVLNNDFKRVSYTEAIDILRDSTPNKKKKFQYLIEEWGADLQSEHERFLVEKHFKCPVILFDYPAKIKAFYMRLNDNTEPGRETVRAMDILFPGIGEIVGGSQREERYDVLVEKMKAIGIDEEELWWYLDTRRFGSAVHSGFGLGFERLVLFVTGMTNIRDVIPFPRTPQNAEF